MRAIKVAPVRPAPARFLGSFRFGKLTRTLYRRDDGSFVSALHSHFGYRLGDGSYRREEEISRPEAFRLARRCMSQNEFLKEFFSDVSKEAA